MSHGRLQQASTDAEAATPGSSRFPRTTTPPIPPTIASQANQPEKAFMGGLRVNSDEHQFGSCYMEQKQGR